MAEQPNQLDYAPAPKPMSRGRLALLVSGAVGGILVIGGARYVLAQSTTRPMIAGKVTAPCPVIVPATTQPSCPVMPGGPGPTTVPVIEQAGSEK